MFLRRAAELLARNRKFWRRFPAPYKGRRILVSPDAALRWLRPSHAAFDDYLMELAKLIEPGMVVWDLGANVGAFAIPAAHRSGAKVVAIEPDPFLVGLLAQTRQANADLDIEIVQAAIAEAAGEAALAIAGRGRACNALTHGHLPHDHGDSRGHLTVRTTTLDDLLDLYPAPDFLKIDIEGAELLALNGARKMLDEVRPVISIEVREETQADVEEYLTARGYRLEGQGNLLARPTSLGDRPGGAVAANAATADG